MPRRKTETIYNRIIHLHKIRKYILENIGDDENTRPAIKNILIELEELKEELLNNVKENTYERRNHRRH